LGGVAWAVWIAVSSPTPARAENNRLIAAMESITADELHDHVDLLAADALEGRAAGSRGGQAAARYIETQLATLGLAPAGEGGRYTQPFYGSHRNVIARLEGHDEAFKDEWIVICAHYDHVGYGTAQTSNGPIGYIHNGADDNASGVAVLLETIEAFWHLHQPPRRSILFAFWDGEEQGLLGSKYWMNHPTVPVSNVRLALNCDMVGRLRNGRLELGGSRSGFGLRQLLASRTLPTDLWIHYDWELKENSDHWPFFQWNIPVVLLHTGLHDDYHRPSDDVERINREGMQDVAAYLFDLAYRAANADDLPRFRSAARSETPFTQRRRERPLAPLPRRLGISFTNSDPPEAMERERENESDSNFGFPPSPDKDVAPTQGVVVTKVEPRSPGDAAGIVVGDRIIELGGQAVTGESQFLRQVQSSPTETRLRLVRAGHAEPTDIDIVLHGEPVHMGISWRDDPAEPSAVYLTRVVPGSLASAAGLRVHDRIYGLDGTAVGGTDSFSQMLDERLKSGEPFMLEVERFGRLLDLEVPESAAGR
jgi:hypothetical protein